MASNGKRTNASLTGPRRGTVKGRPRLSIIGKLHEHAQFAVQNTTNVAACSLSGDGGYESIDLGLAFIERTPRFQGYTPTTMAEELACSLEALARHVRANPDVIGLALQRGATPIHDLLIDDSCKCGIATPVQPEENGND